MNTSDYQVQYRPFKYDATVYKDFSHAKRVVIEDSQPLMKLTLGNEDAELLKQGLGPFDMDDRVGATSELEVRYSAPLTLSLQQQ
jgi:hypothetical protein